MENSYNFLSNMRLRLYWLSLKCILFYTVLCFCTYNLNLQCKPKDKQQAIKNQKKQQAVKAKNNLQQQSLKTIANFAIFPQLCESLNTLSRNLDNQYSNGLSIMKSGNNTLAFLQSYNNKTLIPIHKIFGRPFLLVYHLEKDVLESAHIVLNYSFNNSPQNIINKKFFRNPIPSDPNKRVKFYYITFREKLNISELFLSDLHPYLISFTPDNKAPLVFYYYLAFHKSDLEKKADTNSLTKKKTMHINRGYIVEIKALADGTVVSVTAKENFTTKNFKNYSRLRNIMTNSCQIGDSISPLIVKNSLIQINGSDIKAYINVLNKHHLQNQCLNNFFLSILVVNTNTNRVIKHYSSKKCCDKKLEGLIA